MNIASIAARLRGAYGFVTAEQSVTGRIKTEVSGKTEYFDAGRIARIPLLSPMDFYNATFTSASQALENVGYHGGRSQSIRLDRRTTGTYSDIQLNLQRPVHDTGRIEVLLWVNPEMRAYSATAGVAPACGLTLSPDDVTSTPANYKVLSITNDVLHPGWNRLVFSTRGNAVNNRNAWAVTGTVNDPMAIRFVKFHVSFNSNTPAADRYIRLGGINLLPESTFEDVPTFIFGFEQWGIYDAGVNATLRSYIESVGAQGYLNGRTLNWDAVKQAAAVSAQAAGWDVSHQGNGDNAGNDINFFSYDATYPTSADRLALFQSSYANADAYLSAAGIKQSAFFSFPQNGSFTAANNWLAATGKKLIRINAQMQGQNMDGLNGRFIHSFDFGSNGTASTFANTYSNKLRALIDNGGLLTGYVHQVIADASTPDATGLQQRISEIQRTIDFALDLQQRGLLRVCRPSDIY